MTVTSTLETVSQLFEQAERMYPSRVAVEDWAGRTQSVGGLMRRANRLANALIGRGFSRNDRVAFVGRNCMEYFEVDIALGRTGMTKVPLYFRLNGQELATALAMADAKAVIADVEAAASLDQASYESADMLRVVMGDHDNWYPYEDLLREGSERAPSLAARPSDTYHIRFTSGSTGPPKGVAISQAGARAAILGNCYVFAHEGSTPRPRTLHQAPLVFAGGWSVLPTLLSGGTNVVDRDFTGEAMLNAFAERGVTWMFAVPTMLRQLAATPNIERLANSPLRCLMYAGEPAPLEALSVLTEQSDALVQCFGQTEAPASTTLLSRREHERPELWPSCGTPIPGVDFDVLVDGQVTADAHGQTGELVVRTRSLATALIGAPDEYSNRRLPGGWWRTGDVGYIDEDGRVFIVGRGNDTIITGGTNVHPAEIERALESHESVIEAAVVGIPDPDWGETPAALVYAPQLGEQATTVLDEWIRTRIARFKRPRVIVLTTEPLPRKGTEGKLSRGEARSQIEQELRLQQTSADANGPRSTQ